jgi:hypothetical protein
VLILSVHAQSGAESMILSACTESIILSACMILSHHNESRGDLMAWKQSFSKNLTCTFTYQKHLFWIPINPNQSALSIFTESKIWPSYGPLKKTDFWEPERSLGIDLGTSFASQKLVVILLVPLLLRLRST